MSAAKASAKRVPESENLKPKRQKRVIDEDDFDSVFSSDIKGIMSALQQIKEKALIDGRKKNEETISSVASEMKSSLNELTVKLEKDRQNFTKGLSKSSKECENLLKSETVKFQEVYEKFSKEKSGHLQALKGIIAKYEEQKEMMLVRYEQLSKQRKKEKGMLSELEKANAAKIAQLQQSLEKKKQDDKTFSILRKSLDSFIGNDSDEDFPPDE